MNKNKKLILIISIVLVSIILIIGVSYAALSYTTTSSNQELILGDIWMKYGETKGLTIEDAMPGADYTDYFEFTISGKNTYTKKDIYYDFILNRGDVPTDKTEDNRIPDKYLKFKLVSVDDSGVETEIFADKTYKSLSSHRIHVETIAKNTEDEINRTYRLYMTIDNSLGIGNTENTIFTLEEWEQAFASVKVNVTGDLTEKEVENDTDSSSENALGTIKANVVSYSVSSASEFTGGLVGINTTGTLYNETNDTHTIREYRYTGADVDNYIYYNCPDTAGGKTYGDLDYDYANNCETWRIVGIFNENGEEFLKIMNNNTLTDIPTSYTYNDTVYNIAGYWNNPDTLKSTNYNDWITSGLQYYLNTEEDESETPVAGYLGTLSTNAKNLIRETTYYLGNLVYDTNTAISAYENERNGDNIWPDNEPTWNGKVALLYPSDYGYSANPVNWSNTKLFDDYEDDAVIETTWMMQTANHDANEWFLSPSSSATDYAMFWSSFGSMDECYVDNRRSVRPVLSLNSNTKVLKGDGDVNSPYVVIAG